jgi:predicted ATP-binding protein involved in virulence
MRLTKIQVSKLFGVFEHTIPLKLADRMTIIHGPNGFGKTAILSMLQSLLGGEFAKLRRVPFEKLTLTFEDGRELIVSRKPPAKPHAEPRSVAVSLHFELKPPNGQPQEFALEPRNPRNGIGFPLELIDAQIEELERIGAGTWIQISTGRQLQLEEVLEIYSEMLPIRTRHLPKPPEWLTKLSGEFEVRLIQAQRLITANDGRPARRAQPQLRMEPAVSTYSKELAGSIQQIQAKYGTYSQQLDSTFPTRVIDRKSAAGVDVAQLTTKLQELEEKRGRIILAGLLTKERQAAPIFDPQKPVDDTTKSILALYSEDVEKKLSVFDEITAKVELFKGLVNKRFSYKTLDVEGQSGFRLTSSTGQPLLPADLSSGEQHELVLFYELLFRTKPNALILIDEPELSLHVAWQVEFLKDLARMIKLSSFDAILATHSPQIINDRWDLAVELQGPK